MGTNSLKKSRWVLVSFIALVLINAVYVAWVRRQAINVLSGWLTLMPVIGFFYFLFATIASVELFRGTRLGLSLAYCIILFGAIAVVISYGLVLNKNHLSYFILTVLLVMDALVTFFMTYNQSSFKSE